MTGHESVKHWRKVDLVVRLTSEVSRYIRITFRQSFYGVFAMDDVDSEIERVQLMVRFEKDLHEWLKREKRRSGRSMAWMIENAVNQWRDRLEKGRKTE